ncbi:hypothetical protein MAF45_02410 [Mesosutterella sp. OilRF-GAM-744-9]|uniref:Uncharacterized protein n=1 Tax=Mesosutterella porci TaxID=2915351 RepID=A0ABS9MNW7_9BURK|nr:hypothetical protein [Mesosutterella sp. oilRF-744-WT-GAM-9]MCG5030309.1 hypothetical protein [Mesosutterella sp. oilRF-744-WT-GAM-9]
MPFSAISGGLAEPVTAVGGLAFRDHLDRNLALRLRDALRRRIERDSAVVAEHEGLKAWFARRREAARAAEAAGRPRWGNDWEVRETQA